MSGSFPIFDALVEHLLGAIAPAHALDLGAGAGKYGHLLARVVPACRRTGVELEAGLVGQFALRELYHRLDVADASAWWRDNEAETFDIVFAGDCLQQMPKGQGLDLLNAMVYRTAWLVVVAPEFVVQGALGGLASTVHRSVWSERDLHWHDLWAWDNARSVTLALLRGYRPSPLSIDDFVRQVNEGAVPVRDYDGQGLVRPCRLRLVDHSREVAYRPR